MIIDSLAARAASLLGVRLCDSFPPESLRLPVGLQDLCMLAGMRSRSRNIGATPSKNTSEERRDVFLEGFGLAPGSQDACLLFNILHCEEPLQVLAEAARVVRPAGSVHIIHWRYDSGKLRGPGMDIRPRPEQIVEWGVKAGLTAGPVLDLPPWHYGIRFYAG